MQSKIPSAHALLLLDFEYRLAFGAKAEGNSHVHVAHTSLELREACTKAAQLQKTQQLKSGKSWKFSQPISSSVKQCLKSNNLSYCTQPSYTNQRVRFEM